MRMASFDGGHLVDRERAMTPKECQRALELALRARWLAKFNHLSARQIDAICARVQPPEFAAFVMAEQAKCGPIVRATRAQLE
jgi:hypothetical protein